MKIKARTLLGGLTLAASLLSSTAFAEKTPVSQILLLAAPKDAKTPPKTYGVPGLTVTEHVVPRSTYYEATAAIKQGYCIVEDGGYLALSESTSTNEANEMWRLVEKDGAATLERTRFELVSYLENAWVKSKTSVALHAVATESGVTVWSMKQANGDLVFLARGAEGGREAHLGRKEDDGGAIGNANSGCAFGATRIDANTVNHGGGIAQLNGSLPPVGEGKDKVVPRFTIDISAIRVSRDPEPMITTRVRVRPL